MTSPPETAPSAEAPAAPPPAKKILDLNAFDVTRAVGLEPAVAALVGRRRKAFGPTSVLFYEDPITVVRAEGVFLYGPNGERYLDAYNNVPSVGHCHPHVVAAVARQLATLNTHTRYLYDNVYEYSERLLATMPPEVSNIVFTCTGSESADLAMRIAESAIGGTGFVVTANAYHGNTTAVTAISPSSLSDRPKPAHVETVPAPDVYHRPTGDLAGRFAAEVSAAIARLEARGIKLAAFVADSIFSSDGIYAEPAGFLAPAVEAARAAGGLFVADEVQPGFGRTGEAMWGFARHGLVPDLVVMGKPMGNGFPMGGVAAKPEWLARFGSRNGYFNTFGGNPIAAAAGLAVLDVIEGEGLQANALATGRHLLEALRDLARRDPRIGDVRGAGLYLGVELVTGPDGGAPGRDEPGARRLGDEVPGGDTPGARRPGDEASCTRPPGAKRPDPALATRLVNGLRRRNVLIGAAGLDGNILKIRPPLCFGTEHADTLVAALADALAEEG